MFSVKPHYNVPKFLTKIWALVEDPKTNDFICWSQDGNSFIVLNEENFAKNILPKHFKHNNMASFVRQLNWYGFRKVMQDESGTFKQERIGTGRYHHPFFKQGQEELLSRIKRKVPLGRIEDRTNGPEDVHKILSLIQQVQGRQDVVDSTVESLKRDNEALWKEVLDLRQKHFQHQQLFETVAQSRSLDQVVCLQQNQPLMIDSTGHYNQLLSSKSEGNRMVNEKQLHCLTNREITSDIMGRCSVKEEEPLHSSEDELEDMWANKTEKATTPTKDELPESKKRQSKDSDLDAYEGDDALDISEIDDIEDQDESRTSSCGFGHMRKRRKVKESAGQKIGHLLDQMHKDNIVLTKRVLALEEQSLQKLSEISTTLSTLANFFMNAHHDQRPPQQSLLPSSQPLSKYEDVVNTYQTLS